MGLPATPVSRTIVKRTQVDHEDAIWHEYPISGRTFKVHRILQDPELWARNSAASEPDWAITHAGACVLATRDVFL